MLSLVLNTSLNHSSANDGGAMSVEEYYQLWAEHNRRAYVFHKKNQYQQACNDFIKSLSVSQLLKTQFFQDKKSGLEMLYFSSHNLAACYNTLHKSALATDVLKELHQDLMAIVQNRFASRKLRIEALANLDKSLFSLCSQLAYTNQTKDIHALILQTENVASMVYSQLFDTVSANMSDQ